MIVTQRKTSGFVPMSVIVVTLLAIIVATSGFLVFNNKLQKPTRVSGISSGQHTELDDADLLDSTDRSNQQTSNEPPDNLSLPFDIADIISEQSGINPIGVIRFAQDQGIGHGGIDFLLTQGAPVYVVADGPIVSIKSASDQWGGMGIKQVVSKTGDGEGWTFLYEHVTLVEGVQKGVEVEAGEIIATKTAPNSFTAHFQLSHAFNNYEYNQDIQCWPDFLSADASQQLTQWWDTHRVTEVFTEGWRTVSDEGMYMFRGLLDVSKYPDGPQLCYPMGTDVRVPV